MNSITEIAVYCTEDQILPFFEELSSQGYVWNSGTPLFNNRNEPTIVNIHYKHVFFLMYKKRIMRCTVEDWNGACNEARKEEPDKGLCSFEQFMAYASYTNPTIAEVDIMSVL